LAFEHHAAKTPAEVTEAEIGHAVALAGADLDLVQRAAQEALDVRGGRRAVLGAKAAQQSEDVTGAEARKLGRVRVLLMADNQPHGHVPVAESAEHGLEGRVAEKARVESEAHGRKEVAGLVAAVRPRVLVFGPEAGNADPCGQVQAANKHVLCGSQDSTQPPCGALFPLYLHRFEDAGQGLDRVGRRIADRLDAPLVPSRLR
jgi:hypothetical protein